MIKDISKEDFKSLQKRYLAWFYKVTKEALDKIQRKFTQLEIDEFILQELKQSDKGRRLSQQIKEFAQYIRNKEQAGMNLKYQGKDLRPEYQFLLLKLKAVEKAIVNKMGTRGLNRVRAAYEEEMLRRIMEERQEKR